MVAELKPYSEYRHSPIPWLDELPAHWEIERAKWLFRKMDRRPRKHDEVITCFRDGLVTLRKRRRTRGFTESFKEMGYQGILRGDLVIHAMDAFAGAVGVADADGKGTPVYSVCEPSTKANAFYYAYLVREMARSQWILALGRGIRERSTDFRFEVFSSQLVPVPPLTEQVAIVRFLDHADRRIRRCVHAKMRLIALLNEQKQVIFNGAVTRGLSRDRRLKASGIAWLGALPERWEVTRLKNLTTTVTSGSRGWSKHATNSGPLFIRIGNLTRASIGLDLSDVVRLNLPDSVRGEITRTRVATGDILLSITAFIGSVAIVPPDLGEAYVSQHVACCRLITGVANARWVAYVLLSPIGKTHGMLCMYGGTKQGLSLEDVKNYIVVLPPREEQDALVERIERETSVIDAAIRAAQREIDLLGQSRTRLSADVVSGKLDVREAATRLPDTAEELEELEEMNAVAEGEEDIDEVNDKATIAEADV